MKLSEIKNKKEFAKGKRGVILVGKYHNQKVAIKSQREDIEVTESINNEANKLKVLNKKGIGPKLLSSGKGYIIYKFVEGIFIPEIIEKENKLTIKNVLLEVLRQCFVMDQMKLNKEEMTNPYKHILVKGKKVIMLDFERCTFTTKPKNVTQFLQYIMSSKIIKILNQKGFKINKRKIISAAKRYKSEITKKNFEDIKRII